MRVISGVRRGAKLITREDDGVRPTTDRVKESMFNLLDIGYSGCRVLDLFAGSGALGIEALSRGAEKVICVDNDVRSMDVVKRNYENLRFSELAEFYLCDGLEFLKKTNDEYDIIFLDPPYNKDLILPVMKLLFSRSLLAENGVIVVESDNTDVLPDFEGFFVAKQRRYGRTYVTLYKNEVKTNEDGGVSR